MLLYVYPKKLDLDSFRVFFDEEFAKRNGINRGDVVVLHFKDGEIGAIAEVTTTAVDNGEVGVPKSIWSRYRFSSLEPVVIEVLHQAKSVDYIRKKLKGHQLNEQEIHQIIDDITHRRLTPIEITYFASLGHCPGFNLDEMYYLTKAMVETGDRLSFDDIGEYIVDKHSIGGVPNKAITPVLVPILIEMGFIVPNTFSRAITTPAGTGDIVETVMPVSMGPEQIREVVLKTGGCLAWGGALDLAPADDILIQYEKPLAMESYDKFVVSILAKKVSMGVKYLLLDIPYGKLGKVPEEDVDRVKGLFSSIAERFGLKLAFVTRESLGLDGYGVGPINEIIDVLRILERVEVRPLHVENVVLEMASKLGVLTGKYSTEAEALAEARSILDTGRALRKFWELAKEQGASRIVTSDELQPGAYSERIEWQGKAGEIIGFNRHLIVQIARSLGAPLDKRAGMRFDVFVGDYINKGQPFVTLYAETPQRLSRTLDGFIDRLNELMYIS